MPHTAHFTGFAPGKIILSGEHSVVYGYSAIVMATKIGSTVEVWEEENSLQEHVGAPTDLSAEIVNHFIKKIKEIFATKSQKPTEHLFFDLKTELPVQSGMGSSASFAAACFRALAKWAKIRLADEELFTLVQESEKDIHGNPSGADAAAIIYDGALTFQKLATGVEYQELEVSHLPEFFLMNTGKPQETTKEMVSHVAEILHKKPQTKKILEDIGEVTKQMISNFQKEDQNSFFRLIEKNQRLLENLEVVSEKTKKLIRELEEIGGVAKITGAGGRVEGSGMVIVFHSEPDVLREYCKEKGIDYLVTGIRQRGMS
jgi:mevalonate kinase